MDSLNHSLEFVGHASVGLFISAATLLAVISTVTNILVLKRTHRAVPETDKQSVTLGKHIAIVLENVANTSVSSASTQSDLENEARR